MGNFTSCCFPESSETQTAKLFDVNGNPQQVRLPIKAVEIMLEKPGLAIAPVEELRQTRRVSALRADDELVAGKLYLLVPTGRVHCKVSELEMAIIAPACKQKGGALKLCGSKVSPATTMKPKKVEEDKGFGEESPAPPPRQLSKCKRWSPVLEPIFESC